MNCSECRPVVLVILDGWGIAEPGPGNAIHLADTPCFNRLLARYPHTTLATSGRDVGLIEGQMGNSEVGHLNIGAGFIVNQMITRIDLAIEDESFFGNDALLTAVENARTGHRTLHLIGLVSDGGVHSHIRHLEALLELCRRQQLSRIAIHAILDGRDTSPTSGAGFLSGVNETCMRLGVGSIVSAIGRYFAMDRDRRWHRTRAAFDLLVHGKGIQTTEPIAEVERQYAEGVTDEFMIGIQVNDPEEPPVVIQAGDSVIFFNFRTDRPRQLTQALIGPDPEGESFIDRPAELTFVGMTEYATFLDAPGAFAPTGVEEPLSQVVSAAGLRQFHIAETEKYAHVTYFLNGGREQAFDGEERLMIPSPSVATYDLQPEMSAPGVTEATCDAIASVNYELIVVNFANCDMVGHTGVLDAAIRATEAVDTGLGAVVEATLMAGGCALIIADHGNAEQMYVDDSTEPMTAHTTNPVPCILITPDGSRWRNARLRSGGRLADVAPTLLDLLGLDNAPAMTGSSLIASSG